MRQSFAAFWKRNRAFSQLAIITNLEYRLNYFTDAILQPVVTTLIEITLWYAIFRTSQKTSIAGFSLGHYLSYVMWASFIARITVTWMYEYRMVEDINSGAINGLLVRPMSYYEYYLSQFLGYKLITTLISMAVPLTVELCLTTPTILSRLPLTLLLVIYYLFLIQTLSFCIASSAFYFSRVYSLTVAKNLGLWLLSGELFPLDLLPEPWKHIIIALPFSSATYIPVAYLTGRIQIDTVLQGFISVTIGIIVIAILAKIIWKRGLYQYTGTGA